MLVTSSILLLVVLSAVESFPLNSQGANPSYTFNRPLAAPPQQAFPQYQPQFFITQDSNLQLTRDAQRYFNQQPPQLNRPRFNLPAQQPFVPQQNSQQQLQHQQQQQQHHHQHQHQQQQQQQRQVPVLTKSSNLPSQQNYAPVQQQSRFAQPNQQSLPTKTTGSYNDQDFLSNLKIIDPNGNPRILKDLGLGGDGNQPIEPELEKSLKLIFDAINKDLENAAFVPIDLNGQNQAQYFQGPQQTPFVSQQQQLNYGNARQPQQQQQQQQQQQPQLGYSFTQPKQHQFQYLKPVRSSQNQARPLQVQAVRGTKEGDKSQDERRQIEQVPPHQEKIEQIPLQQEKIEQIPLQQEKIEQIPLQQEKIDQLPIQQEKIAQIPVKGPIEEKLVQQLEDKPQQGPIKSSSQNYREPDTRNRQPQQYLIPQGPSKQSGQFQAPIEQQPIQTPIQIEQQPAQIAHSGDQQQGFDDEPTPLKVVEHDSRSHSKATASQDGQSVRQTRVEQASLSQSVVEQEPLDRAPIVQQKQVDDEQRSQDISYQDRPNSTPTQQLQPVKSNVKKYAGWVPIVQKQADNFEQQKLSQQQDFEQQYEQPEQKLIVQEKVLQLEQVKENFAANQDSSRDALDRRPQQALAQPILSQQAAAPVKQGKSRKSISKNVSQTKTRLSDSEQRTDKFFNRQEQQQQQQRPEEVPIQQQRQQDELSNSNFEQQRQQETDVDDGRKQDFSQEVQRDDTGPVFIAPVVIATTTQKPIIRSEQVKGRKVKLQITDKVRTPIQMVRDQQTKSIKQQSQQASTLEDTKRPKPVQQPVITQAPIRQEKEQQQQVTENLKDSRTPVAIPSFSKGNAKQPLKSSDQQRNTEKISQQRQYVAPSFDQNASQQGVNRPDLRQYQVQVELAQQKEEVSEPKLDSTQRQEETPSTQRNEVFNQQQQQEIQPQVTLIQQNEDTSQQKELAPVQKEELREPKELVQQQREELPQQREETFQQKEELPQQKEELPQQKEEVPQRKEEVPSQKEEIAQPKEELNQQQVQESLPQQPQRQEDVSQQQQDNLSDLNAQQRQEFAPQLPEVTPQVNQGDASVLPQFSQQEQSDNLQANQRQQETTQPQQSVQEEEKRQEDAQVQQPKQLTEDQQQPQLLDQEKQQVADTPQIQEAKTLIEDEPVITTTQRPPIRNIRPLTLKKDESQNAKGDSEELRQDVAPEVKQENLSTTRSKSRVNQQSRQSLKNTGQKQGYQTEDQGASRSQSRQRQNNRQRQQVATNEAVNSNRNSHNERQTNEGYLSAHQLLNTYNPLQFEPERISSLNRNPSSSSQNSNVNSSPSGESY